LKGVRINFNFGGDGEIRTPEGFDTLLPFQGSALDRYATSPNFVKISLLNKNLSLTAMLKEFKEFAIKGNMIDLAVGLAIGTAFGAVIKSLVDDVIMPVLTGLLKIPDFSNQFIVMKNPTGEIYTTVASAKQAGATVFSYGLFINIIITFFVVSVALFFVVKGINKLKRAEEKKEEAKPKGPTEIDLLVEIRDSLKK